MQVKISSLLIAEYGKTEKYNNISNEESFIVQMMTWIPSHNQARLLKVQLTQMEGAWEICGHT